MFAPHLQHFSWYFLPSYEAKFVNDYYAEEIEFTPRLNDRNILNLGRKTIYRNLPFAEFSSLIRPSYLNVFGADFNSSITNPNLGATIDDIAQFDGYRIFLRAEKRQRLSGIRPAQNNSGSAITWTSKAKTTTYSDPVLDGRIYTDDVGRFALNDPADKETWPISSSWAALKGNFFTFDYLDYQNSDLEFCFATANGQDLSFDIEFFDAFFSDLGLTRSLQTSANGAMPGMNSTGWEAWPKYFFDTEYAQEAEVIVGGQTLTMSEATSELGNAPLLFFWRGRRGTQWCFESGGQFFRKRRTELVYDLVGNLDPAQANGGVEASGALRLTLEQEALPCVRAGMYGKTEVIAASADQLGVPHAPERTRNFDEITQFYDLAGNGGNSNSNSSPIEYGVESGFVSGVGGALGDLIEVVDLELSKTEVRTLPNAGEGAEWIFRGMFMVKNS